MEKSIAFNSLKKIKKKYLPLCPDDGDWLAATEIIHGDVCATSAEDATHVFAYLTPQGIAAVREVSLLPLLLRGGRLVTFVFSVPGWRPTASWRWGAVALYLYTGESLESP